MPYGTESGGTSVCRTGNSVIQSFPYLDLHSVFGVLLETLCGLTLLVFVLILAKRTAATPKLSVGRGYYGTQNGRRNANQPHH